MKPYYEDGSCTIYHGKCEEVLPSLSDIGLVVTSPPYNLLENGRRASGSGWSRLEDGYPSYTDNMPHAEYVEWQRAVLSLCWNALSDTGAIFYNHKAICRDGVARMPFELVPNLGWLRQVITWDRMLGFSNSHWYFTPRVEWILLLAKMRFRLTTLGVPDLWRFPPNSDADHPASFPLALPTRAIVNTAAETVLDPFMGTGTTLRAAKDCGRKGIGVEVNERYCEIAAKRLAQEVLPL